MQSLEFVRTFCGRSLTKRGNVVVVVGVYVLDVIVVVVLGHPRAFEGDVRVHDVAKALRSARFISDGNRLGGYQIRVDKTRFECGRQGSVNPGLGETSLVQILVCICF